ncbi:DUF2189 domain-containing protein [Epibacterium ulvae]|uniref:DUF2189 domain-containing protein n=1 Tax=Epibacterium ulvae TaxID=1156985 RepID=UPI001BFC9630|nr:DUF2189 domain-containing protein [Epibacterium ulvae]MBT8155897.1 DUF2189 domain-containing protein [Epibacterium ulvae]
MQQHNERAPELGAPDLAPVTTALLREAMRRGWRDLTRAPLFALTIAGIYVLIGWTLVWITRATGQSYWLVLAVVGFPLFSPFAAVGFYDVSRRFARGAPMDMGKTLTVALRQSKRQLPSLCAIIVVMFLFWFFLAHMVFALFLGHAAMTNISSSLEVYATLQGVKMLAFGTVIGAAFALLLYMITVIALPLLLDREVDFVTAMITSFTYVQLHPGVMLPWGLFIAVLTFVSMLPGFFGLLITLPLLGHATWHLYDMIAYGHVKHPQTAAEIYGKDVF